MSSIVPSYFRKKIQPRLPALLEAAGNNPFLLYYKPGIVETAQVMNIAFDVLPVAYQNYYAFKALPEPEIAYFLHKEAGFGLDCSSIPEKIVAMRIGCGPDGIMYSSNRTTTEEFSFVLGDGGCLVNYDDITALDRVLGIFPRFACFRINPGKRRTGNSIIGDPYNGKYGITYEQIIPAYKKARDLGATEFGIHMMVCSNTKNSEFIVETARAILEVAGLLKRKLGIKVKLVNIGGGFGTPYHPEDPRLDLDHIAREIKKLFESFDREHGFMPRLLTECGRYVTGPHGFLVQRVVSVEKKYRHFVGVEAAMTGCPRPAFYGAYHHIEVYSPKGHLRKGPHHMTNVVGPKCEDWDRLTPVNQERSLPMSVEVGDILVTFNCGAHSAAMADNYNGRLRLPAYLDQNGSNENVIMIRRGETVEDLLTTVMPSPNFVLPGQW
jgi:diaminopimelate decarboxylase